MPASEVRTILAGARRISVLTGAGMSAESGVPTFRDAQTGLWERFDPLTLASPQAWAADPALVWAWYQWRAALVRRAEPHAGHVALAQLAREHEVHVVTQNVDDLHERAGSSVASHLHGSLFAPRCSHCGTPHLRREPLMAEPVERLEPPHCVQCRGVVRPGVVWFGESLPADAWARAEAAMTTCDVLLVIGTSALVQPAASLPEQSILAGIPVIEINPEDTPLTPWMTHTWRTTAAQALPSVVAALNS